MAETSLNGSKTTTPPAAPVAAPMYEPTLSYRQASQTISMLGIRKANSKVWQLLLLGILAGLYIAIGSHLFLVAMKEGMGRIVGGAVFGVGLVLVVVAGAELFTGNIIMVIGALTGRMPMLKMLQSLAVVYVGNLLGAVLLVVLVGGGGLLYRQGAPTDLGTLAATIAETKLKLSFMECFCRGILCNVLVILAIIMAVLSKDIISKVVCCILPIMAFVASSYEHCVANMYLIPAGLLAKQATLSGHMAAWTNLIPVTLGNIVGGLVILMLHPNRIRQFLVLIKGREN